jgi:hypothetical protein
MYATVAAAAQAGLHPKLRPLDLDDFPGRVFGGPQVERLAHRYCNRKAGQRVGVKIKALRNPNPKRTVYNRW